jgi:hypothetical protein
MPLNNAADVASPAYNSIGTMSLGGKIRQKFHRILGDSFIKHYFSFRSRMKKDITVFTRAVQFS